MKDPDAIYLAARELPASGRAAFLEKACEGNADLRIQVDQMLARAPVANDFFDDTSLGTNAGEVAATIIDDTPIAEGPGSVIGRYKVLQQIGEGGMGVVYMAQQTEPINRMVALKIIKLGMDTRSVIARFEAEQQALAMMDHPNIAGVLDAGATETGRPYFVMEIVRGIPITEFCNENKLTVRERLKLFVDVCHAVQHAHQKGIIHRDIKPSNIIVTLHGDQAVPKVIDFGIAKATQGRLTNKTLFTQYSQFIGTPAYMSPEQASMSGLDIDTRSDLYSLGILLYELLTGRTPLDARRLTSEGFDEIRRRIKEEEAQKPSTCLSTMEGTDRTTLARLRRTDVKSIASDLSGDLDWIVMKAIDKDRAQRYESADAFRADINHYLNDEPVIARAPTLVYRSRKFWLRNKLAVTLAGAFTLILVGATVVSTALAFALKKQKDETQAALTKAEKEQAISKETMRFLTKDILAGREGRILLGKDVTLREVILEAEKKLGTSKFKFPIVEATIRLTLAETLYRLGEFDRSNEQFIEGLKLKREELGEDNAQTANDLLAAAYSAARLGREEDAVSLSKEAYTLMKQAGRTNDPLFLEVQLFTLFQGNYIDWFNPTEAVDFLKDQLNKLENTPGAHPAQRLRTLRILTDFLQRLGRWDETIPYVYEGIELVEKNPDLATATSYYFASVHLKNFQRWDDARIAMAKAAEMAERQFDEDDPGYLRICWDAKGQTLTQQGRLEEAREFYEKFYVKLEKFPKFYPDYRFYFIRGYQSCLARSGLDDEAIQLIEDEMIRVKGATNKKDWSLDEYEKFLAQSYLRRDLPDGRERALEILSRKALPDPVAVLRLGERGDLLLRLGKTNEFETLRRDVLTHLKDSDDSMTVVHALNLVLATPMPPDSANEKIIRHWMEVAEKKKGFFGDNRRMSTEFTLGLGHLRFDELDEARTHLKEFINTNNPSSSFFSAMSAYRVLARVEERAGDTVTASHLLAKATTWRTFVDKPEVKPAELSMLKFGEVNGYHSRFFYDRLDQEFSKLPATTVSEAKPTVQ